MTASLRKPGAIGREPHVVRTCSSPRAIPGCVGAACLSGIKASCTDPYCTPESLQEIPENQQEIPKSLQEIPESLQEIPANQEGIPENLQEIPGKLPEMS